MMAPARIRSRPCSGSSSERNAEIGEDEGELADLRQASRDGERGRIGIAKGAHDGKAASDLPTRMMSSVANTGNGSRTRIVGSNSMPTETKNSTAKASRSGSVSVAALLAQFRLAQDHAGEEGAERERDAEQLGRAERDAERDHQH